MNRDQAINLIEFCWGLFFSQSIEDKTSYVSEYCNFVRYNMYTMYNVRFDYFLIAYLNIV